MSAIEPMTACPDCGAEHSLYEEHEPNNCVPVLLESIARLRAELAAAKDLQRYDADFSRRMINERDDARRVVTYLAGQSGNIEDDVEDVLDRAKMLENSHIDHGTLVKLYTAAVEERDAARTALTAAETERDMWRSECESMSSELGLPPTMRPCEGELARWGALVKEVPKLRAEIENWRTLAERTADARKEDQAALTAARAEAREEAADHCARLAERYGADAMDAETQDERALHLHAARTARVCEQIIRALGGEEDRIRAGEKP